MIKQIKEINFPKYATLSQAKVSINDMGDMSISAQVKIDGDIKPNFSFDWEVEFNGERYIQPYRSPQGTKDTSSASSTLELTFYHKAEWLMRSQMFIEMASTDSGTVIADKYEASLGLSLEDFVTAFNKVLNHFFGGTIIMLLNPDGTYSSERKFVSISYSYIWDVLQKMNEIYDVRWRIKTDSETGVFRILVGYPADDVSHIFEYGFSGGLMSVQRQVQSSDIRNRLLGRGGETNLPAYYFKQAPEDSLFDSDPDWIPELANIYFSNLRGKTFRDYVKGWKAKHYGGEAMAEPTEAYTAGYTDAKFDPVEYVDDKDSIAKYGVIIGGLDNNEDIYPSIQGAEGGVDIIVDAEQVTDDDTEKAAESESQTVNINGDSAKVQNVPKNTEVTLKMNDSVRHRFTVPDGYTGYVQIGPVSYTAVSVSTSSSYGRRQIDISAAMVQQSLTTRIFNASTGAEIARDKFSNLDPGEYYWTQEITLLNASDYAASIVNVTFNGLKLTLGSGEVGGWTPTFDIWVKNIWGTEKLSTESDKDYADRVWLPILGDRLGNEAKVVFSSGWLSFSSDWEFTIVGYAYDTSKEGSEWRLTLQKSDAEQEATGKFIPNEGTNAAAGDSFFFIGIDMPYKYVLWAEQRLDDYKKDQLAELAQINPTWVVETDKVRLNQAESEGGTLADSLSAGCSLRLTDKRFIDSAYLNLYVQTISYEWNESTVINPDIEIVLSDKPSPVINAVSQIQGDIEELNKNVTSLSSIKAEILAAVDQMYLRKDGLNDLSLSQTEFRNLINGLGFRPGRIGGSGWGIYRDSVGKAVGEFDRIVVRDSIDVSSISAEQVKQTSGTKIFSEASIVCTDVVEMSTVYRCYFDTKGGELSNMFKTGDIAWCLKYNPDSSQLKYYKRRVTSVGTDYINLSKTDKDGDGVPEYGDSIVQFGSFTDTSRQSAIILNPHDGGSIVVYAGLNAYEITGRNMVGLGFSKETGKAFLYGYGEFFIGDRTLQGNFITFQQKEGETEPNLYVNGNIIIGAGSSGLTNLSEWAGKQAQIDSALADSAAAKLAAENAASAAESAKTDAATAISRLDNMASDEIISAVEKPALVQQSADIVSEYNQIVADCAKYSVTYTAFTTAFNAAIQALDKYTADLTSDTAKESDYDDIAAYYTARQTVLDAIASAAKQLAVEADAKASEAAEKAATLETAVASLEKINDDHYFTIPEKRTVRATMQAITSQKGTSVAYSGTIVRTMVEGDFWKKVTQKEADADSTLSKYVGFYRSQNRTNSSYSTAKLTFTLDADAVVGLQYASYGESIYDYLVFSQLDPSVDLTPDTVSVVGSGNTKGNPDIIFSKTFGMTAGTHTLQIMYMKDASGSYNLDSGFYRITTEVSEGVNGGLTGSFHTVYGLLTDTIDPGGSLRSTFLNSYFTSLVSLMKNTMHLWEDTVTEFTDGSFRDSMAMWLNRYYDKENELRTLVTEKTVMSDYEYLKKVFGKGEVDLLGGAVLAEAVAVKNTGGEVEGLLNGSDTFSDTTHGKVILAGGIPSGEAELNERVAAAETRIFEDGTIKTKKLEAEAGTFSGELNGASGTFTGKITATSGTIGGFEIQTASLYAYGGTESSNTTMTLGPGQCLYTNKRTGTAAGTVDIKSALGMSVLPATSGVDKIALGAEVSVTTGIASDILIGGYFSASGKVQENSQADFGSHALWLEKGNVAGFRPVARVVTTTQTLSKMDSVIVAKNTSSITLTLPTDAEKGQTYLIIHASTTSLTIKGSSSAPILRISTNSSNTSISSTSREGLLLVFDGSEWTLMYLMD